LEHLRYASHEITGGVEDASPFARDVMVEAGTGDRAVEAERSPRGGVRTGSGIDAGDEAAGT
jgi:hypothetical protein